MVILLGQHLIFIVEYPFRYHTRGSWGKGWVLLIFFH